MTELHNAYLAGLIDGEGYLGLIPSRAAGLKQSSYEPVIKIGMTGESVLAVFQPLRARYGGTIEKRKALTKGNREAYTYTLKSKRRVAALLLDIFVHLRIKRQQAQLLVTFCALPSSHSRYKAYDAAVVAQKDAMYHELKRLKQPEPLATTN